MKRIIVIVILTLAVIAFVKLSITEAKTEKTSVVESIDYLCLNSCIQDGYPYWQCDKYCNQ